MEYPSKLSSFIETMDLLLLTETLKFEVTCPVLEAETLPALLLQQLIHYVTVGDELILMKMFPHMDSRIIPEASLPLTQATAIAPSLSSSLGSSLTSPFP